MSEIAKTWAYLRVSTDEQDVASQRVGIEDFCRRNGWRIDGWTMDEGVSGTVEPWRRSLGGMLRKAKSGDRIVFSEISRIGRKVMMVLEFMEKAARKGVRVYTVKDGYQMDDKLASKILLIVFSLAAEIERTLLSERTREGIRRAREAGKPIGRPLGAKNRMLKCERYADLIKRMVDAGEGWEAIGRRCHVSGMTAKRFARSRGYVGEGRKYGPRKHGRNVK